MVPIFGPPHRLTSIIVLAKTRKYVNDYSAANYLAKKL